MWMLADTADHAPEQEIRIPNEWAPTAHQAVLWDSMSPEDGVKRGIAVWHRRAGKDSVAINLICKKAFQRVGTYWHLLPTNVQARRVVWNETDRHQRRIINQAFPEEIREGVKQDEMSIRLINGSLYQLGGSDNYNSLVGSNVVGVVFSEWSLCDPAAWNYIRPILVENNGWALFIYTPRGRNHGWDLWETTKNSDHWYREMLTIDDTCREDGSPIMTAEQVDQEIADGMPEESARQEFYCSFAAGVVGAFFAKQVEAAYRDGRVGRVAHDPRLGVHLYFDLGIDDATAVWVGQRHGWARKWLRYKEWRDTPFEEVCREIAEWRWYRFITINLPHDSKQREKGTGKHMREYAEDAFPDTASVIDHEAYSVQGSITAARVLIGQSWFHVDEEDDSPDSERTDCKRGIQVLLNYQRIWDDKRSTYQEQPYHNWASHGADAFRLAGMDDIDEPVHESSQGPYRKPRVITSRGVRV